MAAIHREYDIHPRKTIKPRRPGYAIARAALVQKFSVDDVLGQRRDARILRVCVFCYD